MGVLPLQFLPEEDPEQMGLTGEEVFEISGLRKAIENYASGQKLDVVARRPDGTEVRFNAILRVDTPQEALYYQHGGILHYVLRQLATGKEKPEAVTPGIASQGDEGCPRSLRGLRGICGRAPKLVHSANRLPRVIVSASLTSPEFRIRSTARGLSSAARRFSFGLGTAPFHS